MFNCINILFLIRETCKWFFSLLEGFGDCFWSAYTSAMSTNNRRSPTAPRSLHCPSHIQVFDKRFGFDILCQLLPQSFKRNFHPWWREFTGLNNINSDSANHLANPFPTQMAFMEKDVLLQNLHFPFLSVPPFLIKSNFYFIHSWKQKEWYLMNTGSVTPKLGRRKVFQLLFLQWNSMGCQHLLEWHGLDQSIFSKESQLKPGSKFFKKQSKQKIQFEANFSASLPMSEVKKFSSVSHYLWIAKKENIKSNKHKATNNVAQTNSYDSGCN